MKTFKGTVVEGDKIGRTIGFPTANLDTQNHKLDSAGVYCGFATVDDNRYRAVLCVNWQNNIEVHILDGFKNDIYGKTVDVEVIKFMRTMQRINDMTLLKTIISKDVDQAQVILA
jgi:riboflavin kinase/FMN adenylyltransferase